MKVLLNDGLNEAGIKIFHGSRLAMATKKRKARTLVKQVGEFDALIVRSAKGLQKKSSSLEPSARHYLSIGQIIRNVRKNNGKV